MLHALDVTAMNPYLSVLWILIWIFAFLGMIGFISFRWGDGLWGAILLSCNLLFATIISVNYYELIGKMLSKSMPFGLFYWDGVAFVALFLLLLLILSLITDRISHVMVVFPFSVEMAAKPILLWGIFVFQIVPVVFFLMQIGPYSPKPFLGSVDFSGERSPSVSNTPDIQVVGVIDNIFNSPGVQTLRRMGSLAVTGTLEFDNQPRNVVNAPEMRVVSLAKTMSNGSLRGLQSPNAFDPNGDFLSRQYNRRSALFTSLWKECSSLHKGDAPSFLGD